MVLTLTDNRVNVDHDALWKALNEFFDSFTDDEWTKKHGKDWTFADVPYHLGYFNRLIADAIKRSNKSSEEDAFSTLEELNSWNNEQFSRRPKGYTPQQAVEEMRETQAYLRRSAREASSDTPVWLPLLTAGGWRSSRFVMAYSFWHTWLHFTEAHLRRHDTLPNIDAPLMKRGLDFTMEVTSKRLNRSLAANERLIWALTLTGDSGGAWTFVIENGECHIVHGDSSRADVTITTDTTTYLKTAAFNIQNPVVSVLTGKTKVRGLTKLNKLQRLFKTPERQVWQPIEQGAATR